MQGLVESVQGLLLVDLKGRPRLSPRLCIDFIGSKRKGAVLIKVS